MTRTLSSLDLSLFGAFVGLLALLWLHRNSQPLIFVVKVVYAVAMAVALRSRNQKVVVRIEPFATLVFPPSKLRR